MNYSFVLLKTEKVLKLEKLTCPRSYNLSVKELVLEQGFLAPGTVSYPLYHVLVLSNGGIC